MFFFPLPRLLASLPSHFPHPSCLPRLHIKAGDWFQTVKQAVFSPALCGKTKIISINTGGSASMVISSMVISISIKLTWLNLTYTQTDGNTFLQSPLGFESHCEPWLWHMCMNIKTCQGCWRRTKIDSCTEGNEDLKLHGFVSWHHLHLLIWSLLTLIWLSSLHSHSRLFSVSFKKFPQQGLHLIVRFN